MQKFIKKILYIQTMINSLRYYRDLELSLSDVDFHQNHTNNCIISPRIHNTYAEEIQDILGVFDKQNINILTIFKIKELINNVRHIRNHDLELIEEHFRGYENNCESSLDNHQQWVNKWNRILGPWA